MPRYTFNLTQTDHKASISSEVGRVDFNGVMLLPFEAAAMADALIDCAQRAEKLGEAHVMAARSAAAFAAAGC